MATQPELIYCANGGRRFAEIAIRYGFTYGAQLPWTVYYQPEFVDQDWKRPDLEGYMAALAQHRPRLASVLDWEFPSQLPEVLAWAESAAAYVSEAVIIIPKVMDGIASLPRVIGGRPVRLGYSVPTKYGGTQVPVWEFAGWPVHLLGGSPRKQKELAHYMDVVSLDGNMLTKMATQRCQFFCADGSARYAKNRWWPTLEEAIGKKRDDGPYLAFERSCKAIKEFWRINKK